MAQRRALLIANSEFEDENISRLYTPKPNVQKLQNVLQSPKIGRFNEVSLLIDQSNTQIQIEISKLLQKSRSDDIVLIYFSGHGIIDERGRLYLAVKNTLIEHPEPTSVPAQYITDQIDGSFATHIILLDCCYSGAFRRSGTQAVVGSSIGTRQIFGGTEHRRIVITASDETSYAWEGDNLVEGTIKNSVFTRHLLAGLENGRADFDHSGEITVGELYRYISDEIKRTNAIQKPQCYPYADVDRDIVIAYNDNLTDLPLDLKQRSNHSDKLVRETAPRGLFEFYRHQVVIDKGDLIPSIISQLQTLAKDPVDDVCKEARTVLRLIEKEEEKIGNPVPIPENVPRLRVFLSSPGDVKDERMIFRQIVRNLNLDDEIKDKVYVEVVAYDRDAPFPFTVNQSPQKTIEDKLPKPSECEIIVVVFWNRIGTPLSIDDYGTKPDGSAYESGTVYEYYDALEGMRTNPDRLPKIIVYRRTAPPPPFHVRPSPQEWLEMATQTEKLDNFFEVQFNNTDGSIKSGCNEYKTIEEFEDIIARHLKEAVLSIIDRRDVGPDVQSVVAVDQSEDFELNDEDLDDIERDWLNWLEEQHRYLEIRGIDIRTNHDAPQSISLDRVFVALRGQKENTYERQHISDVMQSEALKRLQSEMEHHQFSQYEIRQRYNQLLKQVLAESTEQGLALIDRDRPDSGANADDTSVTLGDVFREERQLVILGDPGSGKTTLARWLSLNLARSWRDRKSDEEKLNIAAHLVNPDLDMSPIRNVTRSLGSVRFPILLRIAEYAEKYGDNQREHKPLLSLLSFLGRQSWYGHLPEDTYPNLTPTALNKLFMHHLKNGRVVLILDGMDEVTESEQRRSIVMEIERTIAKLSSWNKKLDIHGTPEQAGGNQVIITSRIAGYYEQPIRGHTKHVTIQPMGENAIRNFCDAWMSAVYDVASTDSTWTKNTAERRAEQLKQAIFREGNESIRELAQNPLLLTIIATIFYEKRGQLPSQRAEVYKMAMDSMFRLWERSRHGFSLNRNELFFILSPLAAHIHTHYSTGLIVHKELEAIVYDRLAQYRFGKTDDNLPGTFKDDVQGFIKVIEEDVGILAPRGHNLYGFLHLTFQEYLAALYLADHRDINEIVDEILLRADDPRWREPILLCLGHVGSEWTPPDQARLLDAILSHERVSESVVPNLILLLARAIPDMPNIQDRLFQNVVEQLLNVYLQQKYLGYSEIVSKRVESAIVTMRNSSKGDLVDLTFKNVLLQPADDTSDLVPIVAQIVKNQEWYTQDITALMIRALPNDRRELSYPIDAALRHVVTPMQSNEKLQPPQKTDDSRLKRLRQALHAIQSGSAIEALTDHKQQLRNAYQAKLEERIAAGRDELEAIRSGELATRLKQELADKRAELERIDEKASRDVDESQGSVENDDTGKKTKRNPFDLPPSNFTRSRINREISRLEQRLNMLSDGQMEANMIAQIDALQQEYQSLLEENNDDMEQ